MTQTLTQFLAENSSDTQLNELFIQALAPSFIQIRNALETSKTGYAGTQNSSGESQLKLDVVSNDILVANLRKTKIEHVAELTGTGERRVFDSLVHSLASEELESTVEVNKNGAFGVAFDPLDGSSLVDANFAIGTIFGIYPTGTNPENFSFIGQTGRAQVASGIVVYGPKTTLLLALPQKGVFNFELEKIAIESSIGESRPSEFVLQSGPLTINPDAKYFAPGNARAAKSRSEYLEVINDWITRGLTLRYSGGMVPDVAHIFAKGSGIFAYPGYSDAPNGKLRMLFECNPISLLIETAGGASTDGKNLILDIPVTELHQRTPIFCGSKSEVLAICSKLAL